jgi:2-methylcitrate dehydratase PrpD
MEECGGIVLRPPAAARARRSGDADAGRVAMDAKSGEPLARAVARFVAGLDGASLPTPVTAALTLAVMDCLASALAGAREPVSRKVLELAAGGLDGEAAVVGHRRRAAAAQAALVNGTMAHACDFDDTSEAMCGHPTAPTLPAILALAEARRRSGRDVLAALAAAIEVETKLGRAAAHEVYRKGWHATAAFGVLGAAAGAAKVLALGADGVAAALGIAASRAAGLRANIGSMTKPLHVGFAARDGVEAALLAEAGVTANVSALDGPCGFLATFAPGYDASVAVGGLGSPFEVIDPGIAFKKYPSCWDTHAAVDAVLALKRAHGLAADGIAEIRCRLAPGMGADLAYREARTPLEGKFSMEFCLAAALVRGRLTPAEFVQDVVDDAAVRRLSGRVLRLVDPALADPDPRSFCAAARVEIDTAGGRTVERTVRHMRGHPRNPMSAAEFEEKFAACARGVLDAGRAQEALGLIAALATLPDVRPLMAALTPAA